MTFQTTVARLREASYAPPAADENPSICRVDRQDLRTALHVIDRLDADLRHAGVITHGAVAEAAFLAVESGRPNMDAIDLARAGIALHSPTMPEHTVCAELVRLATALSAQSAAAKGDAMANLRQLAAALGNRDWKWWDSCSFRRLTFEDGPNRRDGSALHATVQASDGHPDVNMAPGVREFIEAASPRAVCQLADQAARLAAQLRECAETLGTDQIDEQRAMRAYADAVALLDELKGQG